MDWRNVFLFYGIDLCDNSSVWRKCVKFSCLTVFVLFNYFRFIIFAQDFSFKLSKVQSWRLATAFAAIIMSHHYFMIFSKSFLKFHTKAMNMSRTLNCQAKIRKLHRNLSAILICQVFFELYFE